MTNAIHSTKQLVLFINIRQSSLINIRQSSLFSLLERNPIYLSHYAGVESNPGQPNERDPEPASNLHYKALHAGSSSLMGASLSLSFFL